MSADMMSADIMKKIKTLKSVAPNSEWKNTSRNLLMTRIKNDLNEETLSGAPTWAGELVRILFPWQVLKLAAKPAFVLFSIVGLVLGSGLSVSASDTALPGDTLYPLKMATERVQVALTFRQKEQAKIHVELAGKRINEVRKINNNPLPAQNKNQKINIAIDKFQREIGTVKTKLETLEENSGNEAMLEVAKIVDSKTDEYQAVLAETTSDPEVSGEVAEKINQGLALVEELSAQAKQIVKIAAVSEETPAEQAPELNCVENSNANANVSEVNANVSLETDANTNASANPENLDNANTNVNAAPPKVYVKPINPPAITNTPPVIDESQLKVGIDLKQELTGE